MSNPLRLPLRDIAAAVYAGSLDPGELAARARAAAEAARALNIFTCVAEAPAVGRDGPLAGIPYAAKDAIATVALPTCAASPALADWRALADADAVTILAQAGATLVGKTNMHELSFGVTSNNAAFGPVRNPYDTDRIAGGSSGGSAAAVAVGAAAFALAADTGGSARIPAALCALVGFRPTTGRWPDAGLIKVSPTRDTIGAIVRHVDDAALLDAVLTGDDTQVPIPAPASLRLGVLSTPYLHDIDPSVAAVVDAFLDRVRRSGAAVSEHDGTSLDTLEAACGFPIALHEARIEMAALARSLRRELSDFAARIASPDVRAIAESLIVPGDEDGYRHALTVIRPALQAAYVELFAAGVDALLLPTTPLAAARIGEDETVTVDGRPMPTFPTYARHTGPASVAGIPSVSIPIGRTADGLPVGMLVEGPAAADRRLLALTAALAAIAGPVSPPTPD